MQRRKAIKAYSNKCSNILIQKFNFHYLKTGTKTLQATCWQLHRAGCFKLAFFHAQPKRGKGLAADALTGWRCLSSNAHHSGDEPQRAISLKNKQTTKRRCYIKCIKLGGPILVCTVSIKPEPLSWVMPALCKGVVQPRLIEKPVCPGALGDHSGKE